MRTACRSASSSPSAAWCCSAGRQAPSSYVTAPTLIALLEHKPASAPPSTPASSGSWERSRARCSSSSTAPARRTSCSRSRSPPRCSTRVDMLLVTAAMSASGSELGYSGLIRSNVRWTILPFALMASTALMLIVLWQRTPSLFAALAGRLRRSRCTSVRPPRAQRGPALAHRPAHGPRQPSSFPRAVRSGDRDRTRARHTALALPPRPRRLQAGQRPLRAPGGGWRPLQGRGPSALGRRGVPARWRRVRAAAPGCSDADGARDRPVDRRPASARPRSSPGGGLTVSAGVATFPRHGRDRDTLIRVADGALYWAKEQGKNQVAAAEGRWATRRRSACSGQATRLRACARRASLARVVDARHADSGSHSERVALFAGRIAVRLGLPTEQVELTRIAGSLHDLGKLGDPRGDPAQARVADRRGAARASTASSDRLADARQSRRRADRRLGAPPDERWDGCGYPDGLSRDAIPLGSRIVFVADAFDAMTSTRPYRPALRRAEALRELERCSGSQFDPEVVEAFLETVEPRPLATA